MIVVTGVSLAIFAIVAWRSPRYGVFIIIATLPSYLIRFSIGPIPTTMLEAMIWILFLRVLPLRIRGSERGLVIPRSILIPTVLLFLAATVSVSVSPDLRAALGAWKAYFVDPLLFVIVLLSLRNPPLHLPPAPQRGENEKSISPPSKRGEIERGDYSFVVNALALCALAVSLSVIIQWLTGISIPPPWDAEGRATGLFPYPNANGLLLAPIAVLVIARSMATKQSSKRWLYSAIALLSLLAMVLTKTEAGLLAAAVGIVAAVFFHLPRRGKIKMGVLTVAIAAVVLLAAPNPKLITDKLLLRDWSGIVRRHTWSETVTMLRDRPLLGAGLAGYPIVFAPYHTTRDAIEIFQYPHNIFLNFWSETGLLGLIAFAWLFIAVIARRERSERRGDPGVESGLLHSVRNDHISIAAKLALLTLLIHGLVDVPYFKNDLAILFWTFIIIPFLQRGHRGELLENDSQPRQCEANTIV